MGHSDLHYLIQHMQPELQQEQLVFCTVSDDLASTHLANAQAMIRESEGITLVLTLSYASQHQLTFDTVFRQISLTVASDLEAVGLTAAFATALAEHDIPANVLAGYHHDHILVPEHLAEQAMACLTELARQ